MGASVRIEDEAFSDRRYERLAAVAGLADADHARGKMAVLWRQCTLEQRHTLPIEDVVDVLGERGVEALVAARLGEPNSGGVRIRGTRGRIEWLKKLRENGRKGGRPRKTTSEPSGFQELNPPAPAPAPAPVQEREREAPEASGQSGFGFAEGTRTDFPIVTLPPTAPAPKPKRKRATTASPAEHELPADWKPNEDHRELAAELRLDLAREAAKFRGHAETNARKAVRWDAAFGNWLRRAQEFGAKPTGAGPADPYPISNRL